MKTAVLLVFVALALVACGLGGGDETKLSITGPGVKCVTITKDGKEVKQECPDTTTPAPVIVPPVITPGPGPTS